MSRLFWYPGYELPLNNIVRAENCDLFDAAGKRYVDLESGVWCTSIGHGNPRILNIMVKQAKRIAHTGFCFSNKVVESEDFFLNRAVPQVSSGFRRKSSSKALCRPLNPMTASLLLMR